MKDPRQRNLRHQAQGAEPQQLDFAGPKQEAGFRYGPYPLCLSGAYNSAKTVTLCLKILYLADLFPGYRTFVGRKVWDELRKTTMSSFFKFCGRPFWEPKGRRSDSEKILEFNNTSTVIWGHLDDPDTLTLVRGLEINAFLLDQAEELYEEIFTALLPRLGRWDKVTVPQHLIDAYHARGQEWPWIHPATGKHMPPSYALLTCNPDHELHWIYERFHENSAKHWEKHIPVEKEPMRLADQSLAPVGTKVSYHDLGYKMIELSAYDNKYATRQSLQEMESQDETWKRRFLHGKWGIPEGQIHVVTEASVLEPTADVLAHIHSRCILHRAMDHGDSAPTCCIWFGIDGDGNIFAYREYYAPNKLISEHRQNITGLSKEDGERYRSNFADPAIFAPSMQKNSRRWSVAEEYGDVQNLPRETALFWDRGDNDEFGTRNRISEYLKPSGTWEIRDRTAVEVPRIHPITKQKGLWPRLFFIKKSAEYQFGCDQLIRQVKSQRRMKLGTDNGRPIFSDDRDEKIPDHAYDCASPNTTITWSDDGKAWNTSALCNASKHGWVLTPAGPQQYTDLQCYRKNSPMLKVTFQNGTSVTTTPDHLFLTKHGWTEAQDLSLGLSVSRFSTDVTTGRMTKAISSRNQGERRRNVGISIAKYGSSILGRFRRATSFITEMKIGLTTSQKTLSRWTARLMRGCTMPDFLSQGQSPHYDLDLLIGRGRVPVATGSSGMWRLTSTVNSIDEVPYLSVSDAARKQRALPPLSDERNGVSLAATSSDFSEISSIAIAPNEDAWCLTVLHPCSSFLVADGIAIHNCIRYFIASCPALARSVPKQYSERSFYGMRAMAIKAKKKGLMAKLAREAKSA